jgi:hypothetical protein
MDNNGLMGNANEETTSCCIFDIHDGWRVGFSGHCAFWHGASFEYADFFWVVLAVAPVVVARYIIDTRKWRG